jgi:hypothetical protein
MNVNKVIDEVRAEPERAASRERQGVVGRVSSERKRSDDRRRSGIAGEKFRGRKGTDIIGTEARSER